LKKGGVTSAKQRKNVGEGEKSEKATKGAKKPDRKAAGGGGCRK